MEKFARKIEQLIYQKKTLYEKLQAQFVEEKKHVAQMNIDGLWETTAEKKSLAMSIEAIRHEITSLFNEQYSGLDMDVAEMALFDIVQRISLSAEEQTRLNQTVASIRDLKRHIRVLADENQKFVSEYLSVIDGIFSTITNAGRKEQYSRNGMLSKKTETTHLIRAEG